MPIYEYQCTACGHELEMLQKVGDDPLTECPRCQKDTLRKALTAAGFRLKGSGWYETDFKGTKAKKPAEGKAGAETGKATSDTSAKGKSGSASSEKSVASQ